ncbi:MAG: serine protease [Patescibacteria group bacterium]|nr:serine protease [Patescibacteria group bacterium]
MVKKVLVLFGLIFLFSSISHGWERFNRNKNVSVSIGVMEIIRVWEYKIGEITFGPNGLEISKVKTGKTREKLSGGSGSGTVISRDGLILTCDHVINDVDPGIISRRNKSITVRVDINGASKTYKAEVVASDPLNDIAIIKINRSFKSPARLGQKNQIKQGAWFYNWGYPLANLVSPGRGITYNSGYIRNISYKILSYNSPRVLSSMQAIGGMSGSSVFGHDGKIIGMVEAGILSNYSYFDSVFIPIDQIRAVIKRNKIRLR